MLHYALLLLFICFNVIEAYPPNSVPIDWSVVSTSEGTTRTLTSPYLGECVCDITRDLCDENCCCDPDCSESAKAMFTFCVPDLYGYPDIKYCFGVNRATRIKRLNHIHDVYLDKRRQGQGAVCVIRTNHPRNLYKYFKVPTSTRRPSPPLDNTILTVKNLTYYAGQFIPLVKYVNVAASPILQTAGMVRVPLQTSDGSCSKNTRNIGFLSTIQGLACSLNGEQICSQYPAQSFMNLFLTPLEYNTSSPELMPLTMNVLDPSGAVLGTIDPTELGSNSGSFDSVFADGICTNAVVGTSVELFYNMSESTKIGKATINVTVQTVSATTFVPLRFQVTFVEQGKMIPESIIPATPGLSTAGPVRAGTLLSTAQGKVIAEREGGFAVPSGGRSCYLDNYRTVGYMHSVSSAGCSIDVSTDELEEICENGNADIVMRVLNSTYVDGYPSLIDYVAQTNDALTNDTQSWIPIQGIDSLQFTPGTYNSVLRRCSNMVVGVSYQFVIARAGAEYNPQDVIIGAYAQPIIGSWRIRNATDYSGAAITSQKLRFRVWFSRYDPYSQATIRRRVKAPPILPRLDDTIFYPFRKPYPR